MTERARTSLAVMDEARGMFAHMFLLNSGGCINVLASNLDTQEWG